MRINRVIRVIVGVILLAVLVFCIYKRLEASPEPEDPAGETETVETQPAESAEPAATPAPETEAPVETAAPAESAMSPEEQKNAAMGFVDASVNDLYAAVGYPASSDYAPSCIGPGEDGNLYYDGFTVYTYRENGTETVVYVE